MGEIVDVETRFTVQREVADLLVEQVSLNVIGRVLAG